MANLKTTYLGLELENPYIVSSCGLTSTVDKVIKVAEAGAGAVVLKSLFEEDIQAAVSKDTAGASYELHPEAQAYLDQLGMLQKPDSYLELVEQSVKSVQIPVIASLNCFSEDLWLDYAKRIEAMGASAVELNIGHVPENFYEGSEVFENKMLSIVKKAVSALTIPVSVKIGSQFSSLPSVIRKIQNAGAKGVVLFNRFYNLDIDINEIQFKNGNPLSDGDDYFDTLRWTGILSDMSHLDFSAATGIHSAETAIKMILAGSNSIQVCSVLYQKGLSYLTQMIEETKEWMDKKGYAEIKDFYSLLSLNDDKEKKFYNRLQYVKSLKGLK